MVKYVFKTLEKISPSITANLAYYYMSNPRQAKLRDFEKPILQLAKTTKVPFKKFDIMSYEWGEGTKKALLIHGWEGRASNFGAIIPKLVDCGYKVLSFDAPAHGNSSKLRTSWMDFLDVIELFIKQQSYDLIMTHSLGSVMSLKVMSAMEYKGKHMICLTSTDRAMDYLHWILNHLGLTSKTGEALIRIVQKDFSFEPEKWNASEFSKNVTFDKVVFVHDIEDKRVPLDNSMRVQEQMKNSELIKIEGTGHYKMLWSEKTIKVIEEKLSAYQ